MVPPTYTPLIEALGGLAAICSMVSFTPQILKIWREKDATAISSRMYFITVLGFAQWTTYGALIGSWPLVLSNLVCLSLSAGILVLKWWYSNRPQHQPTPAFGGRR